MDLTRVDTVVQFTAGSANVWNNVNVPVPIGAVVIDTVNKIIKEGDGVNLFANLPVCLDYNFTFATSGAVAPVGANDGAIAIADDSLYAPSSTKLSDLLDLINARTAANTPQDTQITNYSATNVIASVAQNTPDGTIVICSDGKYTPGSKTLTQLISDLIIQSTVYGSKMHIGDLKWYADDELTTPVSTQNDILENSTYFCEITGHHDTAEKKIIDFGLSTTQNGVTITNSAKEETSALIAAIYGGTGIEQFYTTVVDSQNNIICCGHTTSEGLGGTNYGDALVVKYDKDLNILARKRYGGTGEERFLGMSVDSNDNIICVGYTNSEGSGDYDTLIVKFDTNLNILARKRYGGTKHDSFNAVAIDKDNNVIVVGNTDSEGPNNVQYMNCLVVKFDSNLNILARKVYGGNYTDYFYNIDIDSNNNIICVGHTKSEGLGGANWGCGLIVKFDTSLNILARKYYGGSADDALFGITIDSNNNIICTGFTYSEGPVNGSAIVIKFDTNLNILARKYYTSAVNSTVFQDAITDSQNNIICTGYTYAEGAGDSESLIVKFDPNLNIISRKIYGGTNYDRFLSVTVDQYDNIIVVGSTKSEGLGGTSLGDCLVVKLPKDFPAGVVTGTVLTGLTLTDSNLTLTDSTLALANSTLSLADSGLTLADSVLTLADSDLTFERDVITAARKTVPTKFLTAIYSSANDDKYLSAAKGINGNFFCAGYTAASGVEIPLIVKYDSNFNVLARKLLNTGLYSGRFNDVITGAGGSPTCVGEFVITSGGAVEAFIVRLGIDLDIIGNKKSMGAAGNDSFLKVAFDSTYSNIYVVGYTTSEGSGLKDALIVKFSLTLTLLYKKRYGGNGNDELNNIAFDSVGNIICTGITASEGANTSGLILKLDTNLNIVLRKFYNSSLGTYTEFRGIAVAADNTTYCVGKVTTATGDRGLIVKMDASLNVTGSKLYGSSVGNTEFANVVLDSVNNVICVGRTSAEGAGSYDALILKVDGLFNILGKKTYGTFGADGNIDCFIDTDDYIVISGYAVIGNTTEAVVAKLPPTLPEGLYTCKNIAGLILSDSQLPLVDDSGTVNNSTLTMADSVLVTATRTFILIDASGGAISDSVILDAVPNVFKVQIGDIVGTDASIPVSFNVATDDGNSVVNKTISVNVQRANIITAIYGGTGIDQLFNSIIDSTGNIYCAGLTYSEGAGGCDMLIIKYDSNLNILAKKRYGGATNDLTYSLAIDSYDNIFVAGMSDSNAGVINDCFIMKISKNLNIVKQRSLGGASSDGFDGICVDSNNNVIVVGYSWSQGYGNADAIVIKFDNNLNIVKQVNYGGAQTEAFYNVCVDHNDNIICCGYTLTEGIAAPTYHSSLIVKYTPDLELIARKVVYGQYESIFYKTAVDSQNNIYAVGGSKAEGTPGSPTYADATIIKFDPNLNVIHKKRYSGSGEDNFFDVIVDAQDTVICVGYFGNSSSAIVQGCLVKFDSNLNVLSAKKYGNTGDTTFRGVIMDKSGSLICTGYTNAEGSGNYDAITVKFPPNIPSGSFVGTSINGLTLSDITNATLSGSILSVADSTLTHVAGALGYTTLAFSPVDSNLTAEREVINL